MINISKGRFWDLPWSLVDGCTPCSPGCDHCWSAGMTKRFHPYAAVGVSSVRRFNDRNGKFNGKIITHPERLSIPLKRKKPTVYAVWNDLFHEAVPVNFLEEALATITLCPQHTFLILTKRAQRLNLMTSDRLRISRTDTWPIENLWLGITICNQQEADEKIPVFLQVPGKKFLSLEPLLGSVDLGLSLFDFNIPDMYDRDHRLYKGHADTGIETVILGGETGPGARPMHPDWVRSIRDQCQSANVPFFFKSWGTATFESQPDYLHRTEHRVKLSGRLLDGRTHDDLPWRIT